MKYCYAVGFIAVLSICLMFGLSDSEKNMIKYAMAGKTEKFTEILNKNQNINVNAKDQNGYTALIWAVINGNEEIVKLLLKKPNIDINTALIKAAINGRKEIVKLLLDQPNIKVNVQNYFGSTALIWAARNGRKEIVELLLDQQNINVNEKDNFGDTALIFAKDETIKKMLETAQNNNIINSFAKALSVLR